MNDLHCLRMVDVSKRFGGVIALSDCSVTVEPGKVTGFVGANGAGKSTLFNILSGVHHPSSGSVSFGGRSISGTATDKLVAFGIVKTFQAPRIFGSLSTRDNLLVAGRGKSDASLISAILGLRDAQLEEVIGVRANEVLQMVGLERVANMSADKLSGGQQKLLELGRSLMLDPRVLLLDEPLAGVTPALFEVIAGAVRGMAERGIAVGIVEHHISFIDLVCDHVYALATGQIIAEGSPQDVLEHPLVISSLLQ